MLAAITDRLSTDLLVTDAQVQRYGKYAMAAGIGYYLVSSSVSAVPADAKYAIDAHLPQGFDRSVIAARLQQRYTKQILQKQLQLTALREKLRTETDREAKLRGWHEVFRLTLVGMLAAAYAHSLTMALFTIKNTVRVLIFVLQQREMASRKPGVLSSRVSSWWYGGTKAVLLEAMMQRALAAEQKSASPFANTGLDEEPIPSIPRDGREAFMRSQFLAHSGGEDAEGNEFLSDDADVDKAFSVQHIMSCAIPLIVECAMKVVADALQRRPSHAFSISGVTTGEELRALLQELALQMERAACVPAWVLQRHTAGSHEATNNNNNNNNNNSLSSGALSEDMRAVSDNASADDDDDIVEFPAGSTAFLGPDGKPVSTRRHGDIPFLPETPEEREARLAEFRRERVAKEQSVAFFQELISSASFSELTVQYACDTLSSACEEAGDIRTVKSYDESTDSVKTLLLVTALEASRQRLFDASFDIPSYMKLFCGEMLRSTCTQ